MQWNVRDQESADETQPTPHWPVFQSGVLSDPRPAGLSASAHPFVVSSSASRILALFIFLMKNTRLDTAGCAANGWRSQSPSVHGP